MEQVAGFLLTHWGLSLAFFLLFTAVLIVELKLRQQQLAGVPPEKVVQLINKEKAVVLDVREKQAFEAGHIVSAQHCPAKAFSEKLKQLEKYRKRPVLLVCENGRESLLLCRALQQKGFDKALLLAGGMQAWRTDGLPVAR